MGDSLLALTAKITCDNNGTLSANRTTVFLQMSRRPLKVKIFLCRGNHLTGCALIVLGMNVRSLTHCRFFVGTFLSIPLCFFPAVGMVGSRYVSALNCEWVYIVEVWLTEFANQKKRMGRGDPQG